jgi:hypothetical protein
MGSIHSEVAQAKQQQAEALAIQQELLARERLQTRLEEMIYQTEKLVAECSKGDSDTPASTWYFLLDGVLRQIEQDGIATPVIKGRDNKAAFERVVREATGQSHLRSVNPWELFTPALPRTTERAKDSCGFGPLPARRSA